MAVESIPTNADRRENGLLRLLRRSDRLQLGALLFPGLFWLILFFAVPLIVIVLYSFLTPGPTGSVIWTFTLNNYARHFTEGVYVNDYWRSLVLGVATTVVWLLIGSRLAHSSVQCSRRWRTRCVF